MGSLRDKVFEELDYFSQVTEVVISSHNELLASIPDRIELTVEDITRNSIPFWRPDKSFGINVKSVLRNNLELEVDYQSNRLINEIADNFEFEISPDFELDIVNKQIKGSITLVKKNSYIDERQLLKLAVDNAVYKLSQETWPNRRLKERVITVLNTLEHGRGQEWLKELQGAVRGSAYLAINNLLNEVIMDNKWRIRDTSIIIKMGTWINDYLSNRENNVGLVNLVKLKIMVDKGQPIYSINEVDNNDAK